MRNPKPKLKQESLIELLKDFRPHRVDAIMEETGYKHFNSVISAIQNYARKGYVFERQNVWGTYTTIKMVHCPEKIKNDSRSIACQNTALCYGKNCYLKDNCVAYKNQMIRIENANQNRRSSAGIQGNNILRQLPA